jgi:hypothetical protein
MPESAGRPSGRTEQTPEPQGHYAGMSYDWRKPTTARITARWWNPDDHRLFTPKSYGWGYALNLYWLIHPMRYFHNGS